MTTTRERTTTRDGDYVQVARNRLIASVLIESGIIVSINYALCFV